MSRLNPVLCCVVMLAGADPRPSGASGSPAAPPPGDTAWVDTGAEAQGGRAFVAWPRERGPAPAVLVLHEWWGVDAHIREVARRIAGQGYLAIVPDLYHGEVAIDPARARALKDALDPAQAFAQLDATVAWLRRQPGSARSRVGVVGFCMGGGLAERYALRGSRLEAVVMFYGSPETDPAKLAALTAPFQGHFGAEDKGIPLAQVAALRAGLARAGHPAQVYVYPGAGHAFMHEGNETWRPDASRQAWARMLGFLQQHLKGH